MLSFKYFVKRFEPPVSYGDITEELNGSQKKVVDSWKGAGERAAQISSNVIPPGQDKITVPFDAPAAPAEPHPDVKAHLEKHGYGDITDYRAGLVQDPKYPDKKNRQLKIGGVLAKTGASPDVVNTFNNDPNRAASRAASSGLSITYSRHPHDVAGMSTNQGWASCMSMGHKGQLGRGDDGYDGDGTGPHDDNDGYGDGPGGAGVYSHYLKPDTMEGTHVAYLHRTDDPEAKKPLARIALKPHEPIDDTGYGKDPDKKTILRAEGRTYGTADDAFGKTVNDWAEKNFPADKDTIYEKNKNLYNDDSREYVGSPEALYNSPNINHQRAAFNSRNNVSSELISKGLQHKDPYIVESAMAHPNATLKHVDEAMGNANARQSIAKRTDLRPDQIAHMAKNYSNEPYTMQPLIKNNKLAPEDVSKLLDKTKIKGVKQAIYQHQNLTSEQLDKGISDKDFEIRAAAAGSKNATDEHLSKAIKDSPYVAGTALGNPNLKASHLMDYFDRKDRNNTNNDYLVFNHPKFNGKHLDKALEWNQPDVTRNRAIENKQMTKEQLQKVAESDPSEKLRNKATRYIKSGAKTGRFPEEKSQFVPFRQIPGAENITVDQLRQWDGIRENPGGGYTQEDIRRAKEAGIIPRVPRGAAPVQADTQRMNRQQEIERMQDQLEFGRRRR